MGLPQKRYQPVQSATWTILGLILTIVIAADGDANASTTKYKINNLNRTKSNVAFTSEGGKESLIIICIVILALSIISISSYYCNFQVHAKKNDYKKVVESELVESDLYENE